MTDLARVRERDMGRCARCGSTDSLHVHHRVLRSHQGGGNPANLATLCAECHGHCHANPAAARREGWLLRSADNPAEVPVRHNAWPAGPVLLGPDFDVRLWDDTLGDPAGLLALWEAIVDEETGGWPVSADGIFSDASPF